MSWQPNKYKQNALADDQTAGLPLFDPAATSPLIPLLRKEREIVLPNWIWDGSGIKAEVYKRCKDNFAEDALEYLSALIKLGGSATDHEVKNYLKWDLHIVSARRNDLKKFGVIESYDGKKKPGPFGVPNTIWFVNFRNLRLIINTN